MAFTINNLKLSYPNLFHPVGFGDDMSNPKYNTQIIIPKDSPAAKQIQAEYAKVAQAALDAKKLTKSNLTPLVRPVGSRVGILIDCDLDREKWPSVIYGGCYVMRAKSAKKPIVCDRAGRVIEDEDEIYGGVIANVNIDIYAYTKGGGGLTVSLNGVQKWEDGERLGGGRPSMGSMFSFDGAGGMFDSAPTIETDEFPF